MTNHIESVYQDFLTSSEKFKPDEVLVFFKKNEIYLNNITRFEKGEELNEYIQLVWQYANALLQKNRFNETIDTVNKYQDIIKCNIEKYSVPKDDWYYGILCIKGIAYYRLRDYKNAIPIFKLLVNEDSRNDNYRIWLSDSQFKSRRQLANIIFIVSALILVVEMLSKSIITSPLIRLWMDAISLCGIIFYFIFDWYAKKSHRITKKNPSVSQH